MADAILDRLVHNAHRIELRGDSLRRSQTAAAEIDYVANARHDPPSGADNDRAEKRSATKPGKAR